MPPIYTPAEEAEQRAADLAGIVVDGVPATKLLDAAPELWGIVETIAKLLDQGAPASMILDENSPTRDAIRDVIAKINGSQA